MQLVSKIYRIYFVITYLIINNLSTTLSEILILLSFYHLGFIQANDCLLIKQIQ